MSVDSATNSQERTLPILISTKFVTNILNRPIFLTKFEIDTLFGQITPKNGCYCFINKWIL